MAAEDFLPSEIARLVYGYLIEEKCIETAKCFLNESPNMLECRSIVRRGKTFKTHIPGYCLLDILHKYCTINCIVQDQLAAYDSTHKLRTCNDVIIQIKFLLQSANTRSEHVQSDHEEAGTNTSSKIHKKRHSSKNENESNVAGQSDDGYQTETPPDSNSIQNTPSVEATPLEQLPGYDLLSTKYDFSQPVVVKTPKKVTENCTPTQQTKENTISQAVQTIINETKDTCGVTEPEKQVLSQEVQTSFKFTEENKLLVAKPTTNSNQKAQIENIKTLEDVNVKRLTTVIRVTRAEDKLSNFTDLKTVTSKINLCNNQEVIHLNDSRDQTSLGSPAIGDEMDIDNDNSSSEENISNVDILIVEQKNQCNPEVVSVDDANLHPVLQNVESAKISGVADNAISSQNAIILDSTDYNKAQKFTENAPNDIPNNAVNAMGPSFFDKNFSNPPKFPDHITSTPLKLFTATQNYETNEWFSTETLPPSNIVSMKETASVAVNGNCPYTQTATENIISPVDGFLSPIICKENTKVAEKILLNCSGAKKDDTLHTPDVPPLIKSFIPTMPPPVLIPNAPPKEKTPVLPKNTDGENVQTLQETSPGFISISSLVKNTEFNRYFSIDSITISQMENTASTVQIQTSVPENQVEDLVGFSGTGLSTFSVNHKKTTEEDGAESRKNENNVTISDVANDKVEETQALLRTKVDDMNGKANESAIKNNALGTEVNGSKSKIEVIQEVVSKPVINPPVPMIIAQTAINEAKEPVGVVTLRDEIDNGSMPNKDVTYPVQIEKKCENSPSQNPSNKVDDKVNNKSQEDIEMELETAIGGIIETSESKQLESENIISKTHDQVNTAAENLFISNQMVNAKPVEPKTKSGSANKESLKSFISKAFESYIHTNKDNATSNHNSETITKNTPKVLVEEPARNQRRSLSTPKKSSSHIRALSFETPIQSRSDSKIGEKTRCPSPESAKRNLKRIHESFKSPPVVNNDFDNQVQTAEEASTIANGANEKMSGTIAKQSQEQEMKKVNVKKSWDSDLRMLCQAPEQPKVVIPKRKYKTKSKEGSSEKKKKRDKSKTPRKEKKGDKTPHKKSKKCEKEKTFKKSKKCEKPRDSEGKGTKSKTGDKLSVKDCNDLGAQIENNLMLIDDTVDQDKAKKKVEMSAKDYTDISAKIENNLLSRKNNKVINKIKSKVKEKLSAKECENISAKIENNLMSIENEKVKVNSTLNNEKVLQINEDKVVNDDECLNGPTSNLNLVADNKQRESNNVDSTTQKISTQSRTKECPPTTNQTAIPAKKDPLEYLLSDSLNEEEVLNDLMELDPGDITNHDQLTSGPIDDEIAEKMQQDELAMTAVLEEANYAVNEKYKSIDDAVQQDFFPETSLLSDGDESQEEGEEKEEKENKEQTEICPLLDDNQKKFVDEKLAEANVPVNESKDKNLQEHEKQTDSEQTIDKPLDSSSKIEVEYNSIEKQRSILTNAEVLSARKVIYDQVSKLEHGKVVKKKYARLKTLDTKLATDSKSQQLDGYKKVHNSASPLKEDESMQMPPTPQIGDPGSNSWIPNSVIVKEDSRTIHSSIPTPLECPPTPKIFITPQKVEDDIAPVVPKKVETVPIYHLTPITFETTKKPEVTEFKVVKEILKKTTLKTPIEEKEEESTTNKIPNTESSNYKDKSSSRLDSEDSDSSSSSDSSDSSSSSSDDDDDDDCSMLQPPELAKARDYSVEAKPMPEKKLEHPVQNEQIVAGNDIDVVEHEEVVVAQESSPTKVLSIHKTDKELAETIKETPAKDENMIPEEGIFETPNVSKPVENPTNLHAKISQIMIMKEQEEIRRLESQQKPKIINVELMSPKFVMKNSTKQATSPPADVAPTTISAKEQIKTNIAEKSQAEVAKAIESIANEKFDESQDTSAASCNIAAEVQPTDKVMKRELSKAIQSITKNDDDEGSSDSSSDDDSSSNSEPNLELVLEDEVKPQLNDETSSDESLGFTNSEPQNTEIHIAFDEKNYKRKRRTEYFTDKQLRIALEDEDGNKLPALTPSCLFIIFDVSPHKNKAAPKKKVKEDVKKKQEEEYDDGDSSEDFVPVKNAKGGTKRRRSNDETKSRKRKKNIFIY